MLETISSDSIPINKTNNPTHVNGISLYNRLAIMISASLMVLILMISWILWFTIGNNAINNYIYLFNQNINNHSGLLISFNEISIITLLVCITAIIFVIIPFIFVKVKNGISAIFSLITFIFSLVVVINLVVFFIFRFSTFQFIFNNNNATLLNTKLNQTLIFLPWFLTAIISCFLLINSLWLTINITIKYKSNALVNPIAKPQVSATNPDNLTTIGDNITIPHLTNQMPINNDPQPININNNFPSSNQHHFDHNQNPTIPDINVNNDNITNPMTQPSLVPSALNQILEVRTQSVPELTTNIYTTPTVNNQPQVNSEQSKYDELANSNPQTISMPSNATNDSNNESQPQNQGGFEVQEKIGSEQQPVILTSHNDINETKLVPPMMTNSELTPTGNIDHWTIEQIQAVWEKAEVIDNVNEKMYRKDYSGAWMFRDAFTTNYEDANNEKTYAWTIVLHRPSNQGGTTDLYNLDPMNIVNAKSKGENYPRWITKLSSKGNENILKEQNWKART